MMLDLERNRVFEWMAMAMRTIRIGWNGGIPVVEQVWPEINDHWHCETCFDIALRKSSDVCPVHGV